jgi:hypothetical protein
MFQGWRVRLQNLLWCVRFVPPVPNLKGAKGAKQLNESLAMTMLEKKGVKFGDSRTFSIRKGQLGINYLTYVDCLVNHCGKFVKWEG